MHSACFFSDKLQMLGLYLDTVVIGHKCLQYVKYTKWINNAKAIAQFYVNNDFFWTKSKKNQQQQQQQQNTLTNPCQNRK